MLRADLTDEVGRFVTKFGMESVLDPFPRYSSALQLQLYLSKSLLFSVSLFAQNRT